jgi:hypothetical protein
MNYKRLFNPFFGAILLAFTWQSNAQNSGSEGPVDFSLKWEKGKTYRHQVTMTQSTEFSSPLLPQPIKQVTSQLQQIDLSILGDRDGAGYEIEAKYASQKTTMKMDGLPNQGGQGTDSSPLEDTDKNIRGASYTVLLDAKGKIEDIRNEEAFYEKALKGIPAAMKPMLESYFTKDALKISTPIFPWLPNEPKSVGDKWPVKKQISMGPLGTIDVNLDIQLSGWEDRKGKNCAVLEFSGTVIGTGEVIANQVVPMKITGGTIFGKAWYDPSNNRVLESETTQSMTMEVEAAGQTMEVPLEQKLRHELTEVRNIGEPSSIIANEDSNDFKLINEEMMSGVPVSFTVEGFVLRTDIGAHTRRIPYGELSQEAVNLLVNKFPDAKPFAQAFIDISSAQVGSLTKLPSIQDPMRPDRPNTASSMFGAFSSTFGYVIIGIAILFNVIAGAAVAGFRNRPTALVCGVSIIMPILGPIMFLCLPGIETEAAATGPVDYDSIAPGADNMTEDGGKQIGKGVAIPKSGKKLSFSTGGSKGGSSSSSGGTGNYDSSLFTADNTEFNRRYFEASFSAFFRVVPGPKEKILAIEIKTARNQYRVKRFSRIAQNEIFAELHNTQGEEKISFIDIISVQVQPK